jgi:hypothetical protein
MRKVPILTRYNMMQWIGGAIVGVLVTAVSQFAYERAQEWRASAQWFDPLVTTIVVAWTLPVIFTYFFYRRFVLDGRAEPAMTRIWFGGMTVAFLGISYYEIASGQAEIFVQKLKDDPFGPTILFTGAIIGLLHSMVRAVLTGDGAERRRRRHRATPPNNADKTPSA